MLTRMTGAMSSIVVLVVAATGLTAQPGRAQSTAAQAKAEAKADECLSKPNAASPRGSHWYYRLDRQTRRRCWYLGPDKLKVRQAAPVERSAPPLSPPPPPRELRADEQMPAQTPARVTTDANPVAASSVTATNFSAGWPAVATAAGSSDGDVTTTAGDDAENAAATETQEDMVWPALTPAGGVAAAQSSEPAPGLGHLVLFLAASVAFVAIAFRAILKLSAAWFARRRPKFAPASPVIRARTPVRPAFEPTIEAMSEPAIARLREVAKRWDSPTRVPRQPRIPAYEVVPDYKVVSDDKVEAPTPRRRAVA
jgi:hypothetical protein